MKFIVGLTGTHGTGKSTIMNGVEQSGYAVNRAQLSRTAQKALGWENLAKAQESAGNMWALQDAVLAAMNQRDADIGSSQRLTLVERTPADLWAYTKMWCGRLGIDHASDDRAQRYLDSCIELSCRYAQFVLIPMRQEIKFVEEPNRADLASREPVDRSIKDFLIHHAVQNSAISMIRGITPEQRVNEAVLTLKLVEESQWH